MSAHSLTQAFGVAACRKGHHVRYVRMQGLFSRLAVARSEGTHHDLIHALKTVSLPVIDDFMTTPISTQSAVDLLEVVEARDGKAATIITSQPRPKDWYPDIDDDLDLPGHRGPEHARAHVQRKDEGEGGRGVIAARPPETP